MKKLILFLLATLCSLPLAASAAQTAQARMYCLSPRFQQATSEDGWYKLNLTMLNVGINGELMPNFEANAPYSHFSYLEMYDGYYDDYVQGALWVDLPTTADVDGNGLPDFFQTSQLVNAKTAGKYDFGGLYPSGIIEALWGRDAGSAYGTCILRFKFPNAINPWLTFTHTFELIEYTGPLAYTPGNTNVTGSVSLTQTGNEANTWQGPVEFIKSPTNRFNELELQAGGWTNASLQVQTFWKDPIYRDLPWTTNYTGYFDFDDGDLATTDADYYTWVLSIDDTHDSDGDGIPDFSDTPAPPARPVLSLASSTNQLLLSIQGTVGMICEIQETAGLTTPNWQKIDSVTLTNTIQTIALPWSTTGPKFWRVRVQ